METPTKQRLIGAMVIVAIAAVFLPVLFYHPVPGIKSLNLSNKIPRASTSSQVVYDLALDNQSPEKKGGQEASIIEQDEIVPSHQLSESELRSQAEKTRTVSEKLLHTANSALVIAEKSKIKENVKKNPKNSARNLSEKKVLLQGETISIPNAWVVQLGSFGDEVNAKRLLTKLRAMNLDAYTRSRYASTGRKIIQVYVGPYIQKDEVQEIQQNLQQNLHLQGVIKKYNLS